jgi:hypothetical protein
MRLPWIAAAGTVLLLASGGLLDALSGHGTGLAFAVVWSSAALVSTGFGLLVALRRPAHPIGWLLLANGGVVAAVGFGGGYGAYAVLGHPGSLPGGTWAILLSDRLWPLLFAGVTAIAWVFPDGRLPSPRWRPWALGAAFSYAGLLVCTLLATEPYAEPFRDVTDRPLPQLPDSVIGIPQALTSLGAIGALLGGVAAVRVRLRRSAGTERRQLQWLAYAAT